MTELILSDDELATLKCMICDVLETYEDYNPNADTYVISDSCDYYLPASHIKKIKELARKIMCPYEKHSMGNLI